MTGYTALTWYPAGSYILGMQKSTSFFLLARFRPLPAIALFLLVNTSLFFAARLALLFFLWPDITARSDIPLALYIGLKFDVRYAVFLTLPVALCLLIPAWDRRLCCAGRSPLRAVLCVVEAALFGAALLTYVFDFGFFFYLRQRLDMTALGFLEDPLISAVMIWESYPVIWLGLFFVLAVIGYGFFVRLVLLRHQPCPVSGEDGGSRLWRAGLTVAVLLALFIMGYGQISSNLFPLRWSNAYFSHDRNIAMLAIHPVQNLYDTRNVGKALPPDEQAVLEAWPRMAAWLGIPAGQKTLDFVRHIPPKAGTPHTRPNIVIILMESLGWPRTSFAPAPDPSVAEDLNPTPFLRELAEKSLYFSNFYAPTRTTARAVFTTITGVPDVNHSGGTTSRNPKLVDQTTVFNEFKEYEKYYLIGGSASWANIRGLLLHNVDGLNLLEESAWEAPNVDVWGVSDLAMLREATALFSKSPQPFLAFIQTASFHRPYTIPEDNEGYVPSPPPSAKALEYYGFENPEEYQSLRFSDWALRRFFERAAKEAWFDNTIFAIFGDHGLGHRSANVSPGYLACELQAWHTPLLLYSPGGLIKPGINSKPYTQPDVFPTLAVLAGLDFRINTLGRDLLDSRHQEDAVAFISATDHQRYLVKDGYAYNWAQDALYRLDSPILENLKEKEPDRAAAMRRQARDFYETSRYLLHHNAKSVLSRKE